MMKWTFPAALLLVLLLGYPSAGLSLRPAHFNELRACADRVVAGTVTSLSSERTLEAGRHGVQTRMVLGQVEILFERPLTPNPSPLERRGEGRKATPNPSSLERREQGRGEGRSPLAPEVGGEGLGVRGVLGLDVILPGGVMDGRSVRVPGAPTFAAGERVVLFLRDGADGAHYLAGHGLGVLRRSADGLKVTPDIACPGGTAAGGETFELFATRFGEKAVDVKSGTIHADEKWAALGGLALLLLSVVLVRMKKYYGALAACAAGLALLLVQSQASAATVGSRGFVALGDRWPLDVPLRGRVDRGEVLWVRGMGTEDLPDDVAFGTISSMFQQWEDLPDSAIAFRQDGVTIESGSVIDERNVISFLERVPRDSFDKLTLAVTFLISDTDTRSLIDTDIVFNDRDVIWVAENSSISLAAVALHEIGHFLGLDHTSDQRDVMFPTAGGLVVLSPGDRAGAEFLYPVDPLAAPVALATASPTAGSAPLNVSFFSEGTYTNTGSTVVFVWDFGDGSAPSMDVAPQHLYEVPGTFTAVLTVSDVEGRSATASVTVVVGNPGVATSVTQFTFNVLLYEPFIFNRGRDRLVVKLSGPELLPGDGLVLKIRNTEFGMNVDNKTTEAGPMVLSAKNVFKGDANLAGRASVRYSSRSKQTTLRFSALFVGQDFDPRGSIDTRQAGGEEYPILLQVSRAGSTIIHSASAPVDFKIKTGRLKGGLIEKAIAGKLRK